MYHTLQECNPAAQAHHHHRRRGLPQTASADRAWRDQWLHRGPGPAACGPTDERWAGYQAAAQDAAAEHEALGWIEAYPDGALDRGTGARCSGSRTPGRTPAGWHSHGGPPR